MQFGYFIFAVAVLAIALPLVAFCLYDKRGERQEAQRLATRKAEREAFRRNFKRQVYPALGADVPSRCRNAPAIPATLDMSESLTSDTSALMTCQVILDGEEALGPLGSWLEKQTGKRIRRLADLESLARRHANQEWLVKFVHPLQSMVYQRHADGNWNLVRVGTGMF